MENIENVQIEPELEKAKEMLHHFDGMSYEEVAGVCNWIKSLAKAKAESNPLGLKSQASQ